MELYCFIAFPKEASRIGRLGPARLAHDGGRRANRGRRVAPPSMAVAASDGPRTPDPLLPAHPAFTLPRRASTPRLARNAHVHAHTRVAASVMPNNTAFPAI